jgi:hypothetical protein
MKSGFKTTEFWFHLGFLIVCNNVLIGIGLMGGKNPTHELILAVTAIAFAAASSYGWLSRRTWLKANEPVQPPTAPPAS